MIFTKKSLLYFVIVILILMLTLFALSPKENVISKAKVIGTEKLISAEHFDFYEKHINNNKASIMAYKTYFADEYSDANFGETNTVRIAYSLEYDYEAELIYVAISTFNDKEELINVELLDAYPIYYDDGTIDSLVRIGENTILLSELQAGTTKDCFAGALVIGGGIALGKLLSGLLISAGVVLGGAAVVKTIEVAVKSGWFTYTTKSLTDSKVKSRIITATKQKTKKNPDVYYLAELSGGKLCINSSPWSLKTASTRIMNYGNSFWTPLELHAKQLALYTSGGYVGPEVDKNNGTPKQGHYYHYHLNNRLWVGGKNIHIWFDKPVGGIY